MLKRALRWSERREKMRPQLHLGEMKNQEVADWFGVSLSSYQNRKRKGTAYLTQLEEYCAFKEKRGGIEILEIYMSEYVPRKSKTDAICKEIAERWTSQPDGYSTAVYLLRDYMGEHCEDSAYAFLWEYNEKTLTRKICGYRQEWWGNGRTVTKGTKGHSKRIQGVKDKETDMPRLMTYEEEKLRNEILTDYRTPKTREEFNDLAVDLLDMHEGEKVDRKEDYTVVLNKFRKMTGLTLVNGTMCWDGKEEKIIWDEEFTF
jgi:hypothetical protein